MTHRVRWAYPAIMGLLIAVYFAAPPARVAAVAMAGLLTAGCMVAAAVFYRSQRLGAWLCLVAGLLVVATAESIYNTSSAAANIDAFPSLPDVLSQVEYPLLAGGLLWLGLARTPAGNLTGWIETAALTLAGTLLSWIILVNPTVIGAQLSGFGRAIVVSAWIGDVAVLAATVQMMTVWPRNRAIRVLGVGAVAFMTSDALYATNLAVGFWRSGRLADLSLLVFFSCFGVAAADPEMARITSRPGSSRQPHPTGLTALAIALLVAPTALVVEAVSGPVRTPFALAAVSAAVGGLVWWRMALAIRGHQRGRFREAEVRRAARQLGLALDTGTVTEILVSALASIAGGAPTSVRVDSDPQDPSAPRSPAAPAAPEESQLAVVVDGHRIIFSTPRSYLAELEDTLGSLASQAGIALKRIELTARIVTSQQERAILAFRADHDPLTGLVNADTFRERLRSVGDADEPGAVTAVMFIDLDDFKTVNDTLGHDAGDAVLIAVADAIRGSLRPDDLGARLGGDEFAVLLRGLDADADAEAATQRLMQAMEPPVLIAGLPIAYQASIGLATATRPEEHSSLLRRADDALYAAKAAGKGLWRRYEPTMSNPVRGDDAFLDHLRRLTRQPAAVQAGGGNLALHYQPIVELATGRVAGYEALIRWRSEDNTTVAGQDLIDAASRAGLMPVVGDWMLGQALTDLPHLPEGYLSINTSAGQLRRRGFLDRVRDQLADAGLPGSRLVIEITEGQLLTDDDPAWADLGGLRRVGVRVAIDDYGAGYASLAYLRHSIIDIVKLDRVFLRDIGNERSRLLLRAIIDLTGQLGIDLIAEGIEDDATRARLVALGCRLGQGHLFAPALPLEELRAWSPPCYPANA